MKSKAVIDIGSNSVRLLITGGKQAPKKYINNTQLAENMDPQKNLSAASMERTINAVKEYVNISRERDISDIFIFATEAVRKASNKKTFLDYLLAETGLETDVISGGLEAEIAYLGVKNKKKGELGVIDIGGASTEIVFGKNRNISYSKSLPIGAVTLRSSCGNDELLLEEHINDCLVYIERKNVRYRLWGIGGTITSLAAIDLSLKVYDPGAVHGYALTLEKLLEIRYKIFKKNGFLGKFEVISAKRAAILPQGIVILTELLKYLEKTKIYVSEMDNLEGYLEYKKM